MSQLTIRQGLQDTLQALAGFASADVTLSDWSILDQPGAAAAAPFAIVPPAISINSRAAIGEGLTSWDIPLILLSAWDADNVTWNDIFEEHAAIEEAVIVGLWADSTPATEAQITAIRALEPIDEYQRGEFTYVGRPLIVTVEEL